MKIIEDIKAKWIAFWRAHGTKILGYVTAGVGVLNEIVAYIQAADPKHAAIWALVIALGAATVKRGHTNSASQQAK